MRMKTTMIATAKTSMPWAANSIHSRICTIVLPPGPGAGHRYIISVAISLAGLFRYPDHNEARCDGLAANEMPEPGGGARVSMFPATSTIRLDRTHQGVRRRSQLNGNGTFHARKSYRRNDRTTH
jgi:hypothetical protein